MKKTYITPEIETVATYATSIIAISVSLDSEDTSVMHVKGTFEGEADIESWCD